MKNKISVILAAFALILLASALEVEARQGCCSHHGGVCPDICPSGGIGYKCCDGTALSDTCAPYYPCKAEPGESGEKKTGRQGCCSKHWGVCPEVCPDRTIGYKCCDGTALSDKCAPYYKTCSKSTAPDVDESKKSAGTGEGEEEKKSASKRRTEPEATAGAGGEKKAAETAPGEKPGEKKKGLKEKLFGTAEEVEKLEEGLKKHNIIQLMAEGAAGTFANLFIVAVFVRLFFQHNMVFPWVTQYGLSFPRNYETAILANPSLKDPTAAGYNPLITEAVGYSIRLMLPFYIMAIVLTGAYMLFVSSSPAGRAKAKNLLKRLVVSMVFFSMSPLIIEVMLVTSQNISSAILSQADPDNVRMVLEGGVWGAYIIFSKLGITDVEIAIAYWTALYVMAWLPYMVIGMRHIMMTLFCMVFPIGIALYSFVFLRGIGRKILEQTMVWIYLQAFLSMAILVISLGSSYYYLVPSDQNPKLTNFPIPLVMDSGIIKLLEWLPGVNIAAGEGPFKLFLLNPIIMYFNFGVTSILAFSIGSMAYALLVAVPFMMLRLLGHFLP